MAAAFEIWIEYARATSSIRLVTFDIEEPEIFLNKCL